MSIDNIPPFGRAPMPKSKGKKPKPPKKKLPEKIKPLDVFKVARDADAGSDSGGSKEAFNHLMRTLSKSQLGRVEGLVQEIQSRTFDDMDEKSRSLAACKRISDAINERSQKSAVIEASINLQIKEKLDAMQLIDFEKSPSGRVKRVYFKSRWVTIPTLVKRFFQAERRVVRQAMAQGILLREVRRQRARAYVEDEIRSYLRKIP
ncbi:MAG: hypothetical protein WD595_03085 [Waddliaceae bacterium]